MTTIRAFFSFLLGFIGTRIANFAERINPNKPDLWDKARAIHKALLKDWNKGKAKEFIMQEAFTTADGCVYYTHNNIGELGTIRAQMLDELMIKAAFADTVNRRFLFEQELEQAIAEKNHKAALEIATNFLLDSKAPPPLLSMCELGALLVFRHDERPDTFNMAIHTDKVRQIQLDDNAQFFFAYAGWAVMMSVLEDLGKQGRLSDWALGSETDFHVYLQAQIRKLNQRKSQKSTT
jgi:hypothetical protein